MSTDDQILAKGRTLQQYINAKDQMVALRDEANRLIHHLNATATQIEHYETALANMDLAFMNPEKVQKLVIDLQQTATEKSRLEAELRNMGVNISDR
jgi:hypothetical protein